jgi:hypothetical protein
VAAPVVGVVGLRALRRDIAKLGEMGGPLTAQLKDAARQAAQPVVVAVVAELPQVDTPLHSAGTLAGDVRITATKTGAAVRMGRSSIPYAGPVDFGGWPEGREYKAEGRYLYPAAEQHAAAIAGLYSAAAQRALDSYRWQNTTTEGASVHD